MQSAQLAQYRQAFLERRELLAKARDENVDAGKALFEHLQRYLAVFAQTEDPVTRLPLLTLIAGSAVANSAWAFTLNACHGPMLSLSILASGAVVVTDERNGHSMYQRLEHRGNGFLLHVGNGARSYQTLIDAFIGRAFGGPAAEPSLGKSVD